LAIDQRRFSLILFAGLVLLPSCSPRKEGSPPNQGALDVARKKKDLADSESHQGGSEAGQHFDPTNLPAEDAEREIASREAPIGRPVSDEEYQEIKKRAAQGRRPRAPNAHEDKSVPAGDEDR
jgi:hypothetical protein